MRDDVALLRGGEQRAVRLRVIGVHGADFKRADRFPDAAQLLLALAVFADQRAGFRVALRADEPRHTEDFRRVLQLKFRRRGRDHNRQIARPVKKPPPQIGARPFVLPKQLGLLFKAEPLGHFAKEHALELRQIAPAQREQHRCADEPGQPRQHGGMTAQAEPRKIHRGIAVVNRAVKIINVDAHTFLRPCFRRG